MDAKFPCPITEENQLFSIFYPKDETPGCTTEALEFSEVAERFEKEGAVILGVSKE